MCTSLATLELPDTLASIGDEAFARCTRLTTLDLPETLTSIGTYTIPYLRLWRVHKPRHAGSDVVVLFVYRTHACYQSGLVRMRRLVM